MALTKCLLGEHIELRGETNTNLTYDLEDVRGVNNLKKLMQTQADMNGRDLSKFQIVYPGEFVFNHRTSRNGNKFSIAYNDGDKPVICTEDYVVFRVKKESLDILSAEWLYMYFNRSEFDRYVITNSWGSSTEFYNWEDICTIEMELPTIAIQKKYVDIYTAMVTNQQSYERGLDDLRMICDGHFDNAKKGKTMPLGELIERVDSRNSNNVFCEADVKGIINNKEFAETRADISSTDLSKFKIVEQWHFAYNSRTSGRDMLVLALNKEEKPVIVTFNYNVFKIRSAMCNVIDAEYLYAYFKRSEFDRRVRFSSWGSSQELLSWDNLCEIVVPTPTIETQRSIANIMNVYILRKNINEQMKAQIKDICPILIRGSLEEAIR